MLFKFYIGVPADVEVTDKPGSTEERLLQAHLRRCRLRARKLPTAARKEDQLTAHVVVAHEELLPEYVRWHDGVEAPRRLDEGHVYQPAHQHAGM